MGFQQTFNQMPIWKIIISGGREFKNTGP